MSRIGKKPVSVPSSVQFAYEGSVLKFNSSLGERSVSVPSSIAVEVEERSITFSNLKEDKKSRAIWGTTRANVSNIVDGLNKKFEYILEIRGVGYKANVQGKNLVLSLGYSHDITFPIPDSVEIACVKNTIVVKSINKQTAGEVSGKIRSFRKPSVYGGRGIRRLNEIVIQKNTKGK